MDVSAIVALSGAAAAGFAILGFWLRFSDRITKAGAEAEAAGKGATEAKKLSDEAHTRISALQAEFGIYRERVALDFVGKEDVRDLKAEVIGAIKELDRKVDDLLTEERRHERHDRRQD